MVSYVLLVVIAIGVSVLVYNYLELSAPKDQATCKEDVSVVLQNYGCKIVDRDRGIIEIQVSLVNKGLHSVDATFLRLAPEGRKVRKLINENDLYFPKLGAASQGLTPGGVVQKVYRTDPDLSFKTEGTYQFEIQPAIFDGKDLALCEEDVVVHDINCVYENP